MCTLVKAASATALFTPLQLVYMHIWYVTYTYTDSNGVNRDNQKPAAELRTQMYNNTRGWIQVHYTVLLKMQASGVWI